MQASLWDALQISLFKRGSCLDAGGKQFSRRSSEYFRNVNKFLLLQSSETCNLWILGRASPFLWKGHEEGRLKLLALFVSEQECQPGSFWPCLSSVRRDAVSSLSPTYISLPKQAGWLSALRGASRGRCPILLLRFERGQLNLAPNPHRSPSHSLGGSLTLSVPRLRSADRTCVETYIFRLTNRYFLTNTPEVFPVNQYLLSCFCV